MMEVQRCMKTKHKHSEKYSFGVQIKSTTETQNSTFIYHVYSDGAPDK